MPKLDENIKKAVDWWGGIVFGPGRVVQKLCPTRMSAVSTNTQYAPEAVPEGRDRFEAALERYIREWLEKYPDDYANLSVDYSPGAELREIVEEAKVTIPFGRWPMKTCMHVEESRVFLRYGDEAEWGEL